MEGDLKMYLMTKFFPCSRFERDFPEAKKLPVLRLIDVPAFSGSCFTLIELLVVIAIIAILASMLMPALNKARQAGQAASCQSNLKQQSVAVFAYADDYKGHYPVYDVNNAGLYAVVLNFCMGSRNNTLDEEHFNPKCGFYGSRAFYCPGKNNTYRQARYVDYGAYYGQWTPSFDQLKIFLLKKTSASILHLESQYGPGEKFGSGNISNVNRISYPHSNRSNTLYFDGHVSTFSRNNMTDQQVKECFEIE